MLSYWEILRFSGVAANILYLGLYPTEIFKLNIKQVFFVTIYNIFSSVLYTIIFALILQIIKICTSEETENNIISFTTKRLISDNRKYVHHDYNNILDIILPSGYLFMSIPMFSTNWIAYWSSMVLVLIYFTYKYNLSIQSILMILFNHLIYSYTYSFIDIIISKVLSNIIDKIYSDYMDKLNLLLLSIPSYFLVNYFYLNSSQLYLINSIDIYNYIVVSLCIGYCYNLGIIFYGMIGLYDIDMYITKRNSWNKMSIFNSFTDYLYLSRVMLEESIFIPVYYDSIWGIENYWLRWCSCIFFALLHISGRDLSIVPFHILCQYMILKLEMPLINRMIAHYLYDIYVCL